MIGDCLDTDTFTNSDSSQQAVYKGLRSRLRGIPLEYKKEIVQFLKLAGPLCFFQILFYLIPFVSTIFCGHLGKTELAGVALAIAVIHGAGFSFGIGLASACNTLMCQTFGSGNLKKVGVILQRGIIILLLACCPCWAIFINTESILLAFNESPEVVRLAQMYVKIFMPALPAVFLFRLQGNYLQSQGIIWPQVITGIVGNVLNTLINYVFLSVLDLGIVGSAAANTISQYCLAVFLFAYILCKGLHKPTWGGWSMECLQEWGLFIRLAIPSVFMQCLDFWILDIGGFLAGLINEVELGSQTILGEVATIFYRFPLGFSAAASVRVGNALGAGNTQQAVLSCKVSIICAVVMAICTAVTILTSKDVLALIFTNEEQIRKRVGEIIFLYAPFCSLDSITCVFGGILNGMAKQKIDALSFLLCYYFVGMPVGLPLMFAAKLGITGLWTGFLISVFLLTVFCITFIVKLDWKKATCKAQGWVGVRMTKESDQAQIMEMQGGSNVLPGFTPDNRDGEHRPWEFNSDLERLHDTDDGNLTTSGEGLSSRQLFLRHGLALCAMLVILAAGILTNILLHAVHK